MTDALAVRQTVTPSEWETYSNMAVTFVNTEFVPRALRGKKEATLAAILSGHELGIGPMQSLKHIAIVDGRPAPSAELMVALVRRAGHSISAQIGPDRAVVHGKRKDNGDEMTVEWTMAMAERAKLAKKQNWTSYPEAMLWNRAVSQLCRALFADVIAGMGHTPEELGAEVDQEGNVIDAEVIEKSGFAAMKEASHASNPEAPDWLIDLLDRHSEDEVLIAANVLLPQEPWNQPVTSALQYIYTAPEDFQTALRDALEPEAEASQEAPNPDNGSDGTEDGGASKEASTRPAVSQPAETEVGGGEGTSHRETAPAPVDDPAEVFQRIDTKRPTWLLKRAIAGEATEIARAAKALPDKAKLRYDDIATLPYEVAVEVEGWVDAQITLGPSSDENATPEQPALGAPA